MSLQPGTRLGPYEVLSLLGAGGMGEVYRARDARLARDVAIKVLRSELFEGEEGRTRFEREARTLASLSHPGIAAVYSFEEIPGPPSSPASPSSPPRHVLVMELLEGESLAERLARGPIPLGQVLKIGQDVCAALAAAHRKGIVHRDLKPANVFLSSSGTKILDFGLAKLRERLETEGVSQLRTEDASPLTGAGTVLGTLPYMAPEQLEGRPADARTDLFALGSVLFEMATGRRPFGGDSSTAVITAILTSDPPDLSSIRTVTPPALDRAVRTCLAKDPDARWQSAADLGRELSWIAGAGAPAPMRTASPSDGARRTLPWVVAGAAILVAVATLVIPMRPRRTGGPVRVIRFDLPPPPGHAFLSSVETTILGVSPDGTKIAFVATEVPRSGPTPTGNTQPGEDRGIWIRDLSDEHSRRVPGTEGASSVFWSPDGRSLAFFTPGTLKRIELGATTAVTVCNVPVGAGRSGTWGSRGDILFANVQAGSISRVSAGGGAPETLVQADAAAGEIRIPWVAFLPDGARFLYAVRLKDGTGRLMFLEPGGKPRPLMTLFSSIQYSEPGFVLYAQEGALFARRLDWRNGRVSGEPRPVAPQVAYFLSSGRATFAVSSNGTLAYQSHRSVSHVAWFDRTGRELAAVGPPGDYLSVALTRDGRRVYYDRTQPGIGTWDVWAFDFDRNVESRVTSSPDTEVYPRELPGRSSVVYSASRKGQPQLFRLDLASGREEALVPGEGTFQVVQDVSSDGTTLVYTERSATTPFDIWALPLAPGGKPLPVLRSPASKDDVRFSPDGRSLAYVSDESGKPEVYVMPYPEPGEKLQVSSGGGRLPRWSRDGRELCYQSADARILSVPVETSPALRVGTPRELFRHAGKPWASFDVAPDGRFLAIVPDVVASEQPLTVVVDALAESAP